MLRNLASGLSRISISPNNPQIVYSGLRHLYTPKALGLDKYQESRDRASMQFTGQQMKDNFKTRMQDLIKPDSPNLVFTDDLKTMLNLSDDTSSDLELLSQLIQKFQGQSTGLRFGTFVFGPVIMRFFYLANKPNEALALLKNPKCTPMFDQFISYQIILDLLLERKMYAEVSEVFDILQDRNIHGTKFPKNCTILVLAALYRMNTPDSYAKMIKLMKAASEAGHVPMRRTLTYAAALALKNNDPNTALSFLSECQQANYITVRNLKTLAHIQLGNLDQVLGFLRSAVDFDIPGRQQRTIPKSVVDAASTAVNGSDNKELQLEFSRLQKLILERKLCDEQQSLDDLLDLPIDQVEPRARDWGNNAVNASFNRGRDRYGEGDRDRGYRNDGPKYPPRRSGLADME